MKYMGSKNRIAKHILPIMQKARKEGQIWVEPFVGGGNMIDKVDGERIVADSNKYLISLWEALQNGWVPSFITKEMYHKVKDNKCKYQDYIVGWVGFGCSYNGKYFGGYSGVIKTKINTIRNYQEEAINAVLKQKEKLKDVCFIHSSYNNLLVPEKSLIYCDPPYANTTKYKDAFDHEVFWNWCKEMIDKGHTVFVSEYTAPDGWVSVWSKEIVSSLTLDTGAKKGIENLFIHESQLDLLEVSNELRL